MVSAVLATAAISMAACGNNGGMISKEPNVGVPAGVTEAVSSYAKTACYEQEKGNDVKIPFEADKIQKVSFMYRVLSSSDWSYKNDTLTVKARVFKNETAGEKRLRVFVDDHYVEIKVRVVTKVIYTVGDFNSIRNNLNGVYVLGCDIDFAGEEFWPIGKAAVANEDGNYSSSSFEGVFDGMGYAVKNVKISPMDHRETEDGNGQGPSLGGNKGENGHAMGYAYSTGIFMTTSANSQIVNTRFLNISVECQGLSGPVVGTNGGLIKNCFVTSTLTAHKVEWSVENAGGIAGQNAGGDMAGKIENCIAIYSCPSGGARGIADWNNGTIRNCYAATVDSYVFHPGYDSETHSVPADFDYDDFFNELIENKDIDRLFGNDAKGIPSVISGNYTLPALPGMHGWDEYGTITIPNGDGFRSFYKGGDIINTETVRRDYLLDPAHFAAEDGWDTDIWDFTYGAIPTLKIQSR